jgi:hypothetical protein
VTKFVFIDVSIISASSNALVIIGFDSESAFNDASAKYSSKGFTFYTDNRTMEIFSVPIQFTLNPTKFVPVTATLIADNATAYASDLNNIVYARSVLPGDVFFSFESWAAWRYRSFRPSALIACGGSYAVGGLQVNKIGNPSIAAEITVPVVHISLSSSEALFDLLQTSGGLLNITITDSPENPFLDRRTGGLFIFYSALLCSWAACIFVMSILTLFRRGIGRNLGTICLSLDLLGSCVRFAFALDPWADRFMPPQVIDILFTSSWTIVISGTILLLSFWHELTTQVSMNITSVLDKNTIPTIVTISFLFVIEIISDILRCIRVRFISLDGHFSAPKLILTLQFLQYNGDIVQGIVVVIYLIVAIVVSCFFIYVFVRVTKFLSDKGLGGRKESVLRTVRSQKLVFKIPS